MPDETLIPILSVDDGERAATFYEDLGFAVANRWPGYWVLRRDELELHLGEADGHDPLTTAGSIYLRVGDPDAIHVELRRRLDDRGALFLAPASGLTPELTAEVRSRQEHGEVIRLHEIEDKPWGMREFAVIDPAGNLVRIGRPTDDRHG